MLQFENLKGNAVRLSLISVSGTLWK